jgi:hypothetical protein
MAPTELDNRIASCPQEMRRYDPHELHHPAPGLPGTYRSFAASALFGPEN